MAHARIGRRHHRATLLVLTGDAVAYSLLQSILTPALPQIERTFDASTGATAWVLSAYLLSAAVSTPIVGRLGDMYGKQRVLVAVLGLLALGTLVAALSRSLGVLILGRAIQGAAGGVFPLAFGIVRDELPAGRVAAGIGLVSAVLGVGAAAGTVMSGAIIESLSYHWLFWIPLGPLLAALVATAVVVPESPVRSPGRINWAAAGLLSAGLALVLLAITGAAGSGWASPRTLGLLAAGAAALALWIAVETRSRQPLVDVRTLRRRTIWATNLAGLLLAVGMFCAFVLIPQIVQVPAGGGFGLGATPFEAGLFLLPTTVTMLVAGSSAGMLGRRFGERATLIAGAAISAAAFALLALAHDAEWQVYVAATLAGTGIGLSFAAMPNLIVAAVAPEETGVATGMNTVTRWVGGALGSQAAATVLSASAVDGLPSDAGFTLAFVLTAAALVVAGMAAAAVPGRPIGSVPTPVPTTRGAP